MEKVPPNSDNYEHSNLPGENIHHDPSPERVPVLDVRFGHLDLIAPEGQSWPEWVITHGVDAAEREDQEIDDRTAFYIAGWLRNDRTSALRNFTATGAIDETNIRDELVHSLPGQTQQVRSWIGWFARYCLSREDHGVVGQWQPEIDRLDRADVERVRREAITANDDILFQRVPGHQRIGNAGRIGWYGMIRHDGRAGGWIVGEAEPGVRHVWETDSNRELEAVLVELVERQRQWILDTWGPAPTAPEQGATHREEGSSDAPDSGSPRSQPPSQ